MLLTSFFLWSFVHGSGPLSGVEPFEGVQDCCEGTGKPNLIYIYLLIISFVGNGVLNMVL